MSMQGSYIELSGIFRNSQFKRVLEDAKNPVLDRQIKKISRKLDINPFAARFEILDALYSTLLNEYRCEYVYKNLISKKILLGKHSLRSSTLLSEFRVGSSLADTVIINGVSTVYEIKTELDSPERLLNQLSEYQKVFPIIYLVVHHTHASRYLSMINDSSVGLLVLTKRNQLSTRKTAMPNTTNLDIISMFKTLRKEEYSRIIAEIFGSIPDVSNMFIFRESLNLAKKIDAVEFCNLMSQELKKRKTKLPSVFMSGKIPEPLTHICLALNPDEKQFSHLFSYLNQPLT